MTTLSALEQELEKITDQLIECSDGGTTVVTVERSKSIRESILRVVEVALEESRIVKIMENPDIEEYCDGWYAAMDYQAGTIKAIVQSLRQEGGEGK